MEKKGGETRKRRKKREEGRGGKVDEGREILEEKKKKEEGKGIPKRPENIGDVRETRVFSGAMSAPRKNVACSAAGGRMKPRRPWSRILTTSGPRPKPRSYVNFRLVD